MIRSTEFGRWQVSPNPDTNNTNGRVPSCCRLSEKMRVEAQKIGMSDNWAPPLIDGDWRGKSFISAEQLTESDMAEILKSARMIVDTVESGATKGHGELAKWLFPDKNMFTAFYEPSTRTRGSFEMAMEMLGGKVVSNPDMVRMSSAYKGESVYDNARVMACLSPLIVQRHDEEGAAAIAAYAIQDFERLDGKKAQIINAGDGVGEHPTQALLDVATIIWEKGLSGQEGLRRLKVGMLGDLKHGRTVHSLAKLLTLLGGPKEFVFISPEELAMPLDVLDHGQVNGQKITQTDDLKRELPELDVLYVTRLQKERFRQVEDYERLRGGYAVTPEILKGAKEDLIIMHPLPRVDEIPPIVDRDPRAAYFRQVEYGLYVRMALLCQMAGRPYPHNGDSVRRQ